MYASQDFNPGTYGGHHQSSQRMQNPNYSSTNFNRVNSFYTTSRDGLKKQMSYYKIWNSYERAAREREDIQRRREVILDIQENWAQFPQFEEILSYDRIMSMDLDHLQYMIEDLKLRLRMEEAARKIQQRFRSYLHEVTTANYHRAREEAAKRIQRQWKVHRMRRFRDSIINHKKSKATTNVQKYLKGYHVAKKYEEVYINLRLHKNLEYFADVQKKNYDGAQLTIRYFWARWKREKQRKKAAQKPGTKSKVKPYIDGGAHGLKVTKGATYDANRKSLGRTPAGKQFTKKASNPGAASYNRRGTVLPGAALGKSGSLAPPGATGGSSLAGSRQGSKANLPKAGTTADSPTKLSMASLHSETGGEVPSESSTAKPEIQAAA